ncbi:MAG: Co2+/Mg2+ efflux protein ApaG [Alphaproteobacteria bacterium]|nr:Co2+/Mg2+ efflux protein ApaG [Alphaproteobacteria bacterium]
MQQLLSYTQTTETVRITVYPIYLDGQSIPESNEFLWAYHIRIENLGEERFQLRKRYWKITDGFGRIQEVWGDGVVGEEPFLKPGDTFEYTSGTPLPTPSGIMVGFYVMEKENGDRFQVEVPAFSLDSPFETTSIN